jgi:hypothetical protein
MVEGKPKFIMAIVLEKRIRKLETVMRIGRCTSPEHQSVMWVGPEHPGEDQAKIDSMRLCLKCRDRRIIIFVTNVPDDED